LSGLLPNVDPNGLLEYSVVYTDRALNHMSMAFQEVMRDISSTLKEAYAADAVAVVPGSGTFAMEAVARQLATDAVAVVVRNGWFSYRWTQILDTGRIPIRHTVLKARQVRDGLKAPFAPAPVEEVVAEISRERPDIVFAPHVETASGMILPDDYVSAVAAAAHEVGALMVLDCIASGCVWVDMRALGVDVLISAPQKGWTGSPCAGLVMLGERALERVESTTSTSFACDLKKWLQIMRAYEGGGHAYHATMPTDGLRTFRNAMGSHQGPADRARIQGTGGAGVERVPERGGRRLQSARGGRQLHGRRRHQHGKEVRPGRTPDRRGRASHGR
jgi:aspartate aminotransferase-like enzyme